MSEASRRADSPWQPARFESPLPQARILAWIVSRRLSRNSGAGSRIGAGAASSSVQQVEPIVSGRLDAGFAASHNTLHKEFGSLEFAQDRMVLAVPKVMQ